MSEWIWAVSQENWDVLKEHNVWAVDHKYKIENIKQNDHIVFYVSKSGLLGGVFKVNSEWYESKELIWNDERQSNIKKYPHECTLDPVVVNSVVYNNIMHKLDFATPYRSNPYVVLRPSRRGPSNFNKPIAEKDMQTIINNMKTTTLKVATEPQDTSEARHDEIVDNLKQIGDALGFDADNTAEHTRLTDGSLLDLVWTARISNIGRAKYVFEVQRGGSIKSLIYNLSLALDDPDVRKGVVVSDKKQILQIREKIDANRSIPKDSIVYLDTSVVQDCIKLLPTLNKIKKIL